MHYGPNQRYDPHLDFSDKGIPDQRLLTLLLYVDLPEAGGATRIPGWESKCDRVDAAGRRPMS